MPDYEVEVLVLTKHIVKVNHPTPEAAHEDAIEIARRHTEGDIFHARVVAWTDLSTGAKDVQPWPEKLGGK